MKFVLSPFSLDCIDDPFFSATFFFTLFIVASKKDEFGIERTTMSVGSLYSNYVKREKSEIMLGRERTLKNGFPNDH